MKLIEQILDNFQEASFVKDLKQHFYNKNDNICDLDESKGLIYYKDFYYVSPRPTQYMSFKHIMTFPSTMTSAVYMVVKERNLHCFHLWWFCLLPTTHAISCHWPNKYNCIWIIDNHSIFYVLVFEPFHEPMIFGRRIWPPPLHEIDVENLFEVKKIVASCISCRCLEY